MDSLTSRRRRDSNDEAGHCTSTPSSSLSSSSLSQGREIVPELYKSAGRKRFRAEQPANDEEREMMRSLPCDTESALLLLRAQFPSQVFQGRLPPIIMYSQLGAILDNQFLIDTQLTKLAKDNKILTFSSFTSSNYLIVFLDDFANLEREGIFKRFVTQAVAASMDNSRGEGDELRITRSVENSKYFSKESLRKRWKFEEDEIRKLVNGGYLGIKDSGLYCISLPGAGEFVKCYEKGKKSVLGAIRRAKFGEILQTVSY